VGEALVEKLKELIPRQMFEVPVQAQSARISISRETIRAMAQERAGQVLRGDITRKRKLLEKQKKASSG